MGNCTARTSDDDDPKQMPNLMPNPNPINPYPQQGLYPFKEITFDSRLESGNLSKVSRVTGKQYNLYIAPDNWGTKFETKHKVWFHFRACNIKIPEGEQSITISFCIKNMNRTQLKNYRNGMTPVYQSASTNNQWSYLPNGIQGVTLIQNHLELKFDFTFTEGDAKSGVLFAYTFPYTYTDCLNMCEDIEEKLTNDQDIYFKRELVNYSLEKRRIDLLTLTWRCEESETSKQHEKVLKDLFPDYNKVQTNQADDQQETEQQRPIRFKNKKYILLSARIHPSETPANHMLSQFLTRLIDKNDPLSQSLLKNFVFVVIPMINPDGVFRGHHRSDTQGLDLNRTYTLVSVSRHPGPLAVKKIAKQIGERLYMFLDFHAHCNKDSGFVFGNHSHNPETKALTRSFAMLMDIYSSYFDLNGCGFGAPLKEGQKRKGVAKTEIGLVTNCPLCFTLESGYHLSRKDPHRYNPQENPNKDLKQQALQKLNIAEFNEIGDAARHAIADLAGIHPQSKLPQTIFPDKASIMERCYEMFGRSQQQYQTEENEEQDDD